MSTSVTVAVAAPNHRAVLVHVEDKTGTQWRYTETQEVRKDGARTFLVHGTRRLVIEEVDHD